MITSSRYEGHRGYIRQSCGRILSFRTLLLAATANTIGCDREQRLSPEPTNPSDRKTGALAELSIYIYICTAVGGGDELVRVQRRRPG